MSLLMINPETRDLLAYLDAQRAHVLGSLEGLEDDVLRRAMLPSGWSCLGLVQHLALDVERFWFRAIVAGEPVAIDELATTADPWLVSADTSAASILETYRRESELANTIIASTSLDAPPAWWPADLFGDFRLDTLRQVVLHVMTETATHAGHLDIVRELIDGRQWLVLTASTEAPASG